VDEAHKIKSHRGATYHSSRRSSATSSCCSRRRRCRTTARAVQPHHPAPPGQLARGKNSAPRTWWGAIAAAQGPRSLRASPSVMIRTRRASVVDDLTCRPAPRHPVVKLTKAEADLYERTTQFLRRLYREGFVQHEDTRMTRRTEAHRGARASMRGRRMIHLRQRCAPRPRRWRNRSRIWPKRAHQARIAPSRASSRTRAQVTTHPSSTYSPKS